MKIFQSLMSSFHYCIYCQAPGPLLGPGQGPGKGPGKGQGPRQGP